MPSHLQPILFTYLPKTDLDEIMNNKISRKEIKKKKKTFLIDRVGAGTLITNIIS